MPYRMKDIGDLDGLLSVAQAHPQYLALGTAASVAFLVARHRRGLTVTMRPRIADMPARPFPHPFHNLNGK